MSIRRKTPWQKAKRSSSKSFPPCHSLFMPPRVIPDSPSNGSNKHRKRRDQGRFLARVALMLWMPTVALGIGSLMVGHWAPLPTPSAAQGTPLSAALVQLVEDGATAPGAGPQRSERWKLVHVLYENCGCSRRAVSYTHLTLPTTPYV